MFICLQITSGSSKIAPVTIEDQQQCKAKAEFICDVLVNNTIWKYFSVLHVNCAFQLMGPMNNNKRSGA